MKLTEKMDFPYINANFNMEGEMVFEPYAIKEFVAVEAAPEA